MKIPQLQQRLRIIPSNTPILIDTPNSLLNRLSIIIPPSTSILNLLIRIINTKEHTIRPKFINDILQRMRREMPTSGDPDILLEVVIDSLLAHDIPSFLSDRFLHILEPVVNAPEVERDVLAIMADNDLRCREAVEDAVRD